MTVSAHGWPRRVRGLTTRLLPWGGAITRVHGGPARVALTFDDGPDPVSTPLVLDVLARHGASATFFCLGSRAAREPDLVARIASDGHQLASHGWDHLSAVDQPAAGGLRAQHRSVRDTLVALGPHASRRHRPPYGHESRWTKMAAAACGCSVVAWSDSPRDWLDHSVDDLTTLLDQALRPGAIVLLHDGLVDAVVTDDDRPVLIAALDRMLAGTDEFEFVTLDELLHGGSIVRRRRRMVPGPAPADSAPSGHADR